MQTAGTGGKGDLASWYFEPIQPQGIISGLKTNSSFSPSHSFHKSPHHRPLFLKSKLKLYPQFWNANPEKQQHMVWNLFLFRGHSTRELHQGSVTRNRVTYLQVNTGTGVSHSQHRKTLEVTVVIIMNTVHCRYGWWEIYTLYDNYEQCTLQVRLGEGICTRCDNCEHCVRLVRPAFWGDVTGMIILDTVQDGWWRGCNRCDIYVQVL